MKPPMKLRTRLFLSFSAMITVALIGLVLGLVSVLQMAQSQENLIRSNFNTLDQGLKMRQTLGDQLAMTFGGSLDRQAFGKSQAQFQLLVQQALEEETTPQQHENLLRIERDYSVYLQAFNRAIADTTDLRNDPAMNRAFDVVRNDLIEAYKDALVEISESERAAHEHALLVSVLLALVGLAVLAVGFITAHSVARRIGEPIEALAKAADEIGQGHYDVALPTSPTVELNQLSHRFGSMAASVRDHQESNVNELLAGQQRLQAVLDSIDDGLLMIDRKGLIEHLNPVAQRQLGWEDDRLGNSLGMALGRPDLNEAIQLILRGGTLERPPSDLALEVDGENRLLTYSLTPVSHTAGHILGAVMVLHDVTEQRAFERVRSEFVLRASHELRTPVTGMHMAFGLLRERMTFPEQSREADLFDTVYEEMQRLMQLINDLLNFSRYQNGLQKLELVPCIIEDLLQRAHSRFSEAANEQGVELLIDHAEALPRLHADPSQLDRVLDNLLDNALRHTPVRGRIRLQARRHAERVIISVEDNGEGIAYGQQGRIFEPFVQVGRKKGGAGLGLALCKEIVQLHGGRMGVYSRPGQGTQFYMTLPI